VKLRIVSKDKPTNDFNEGFIIAYVGKALNRYYVHEGVVEVPNIPEALNNKTITVEPRIDKYELAGPREVVVARDKDYIDIPLVRTEGSLSTSVRGSVMDEKGKVVKNALLDFESGLATGHTNEEGNFSLTVRLPEGQRPRLRVFVDGVLRFNEPVTISSTIPNQIKLDPAP
jgi:hypothetical protein